MISFIFLLFLLFSFSSFPLIFRVLHCCLCTSSKFLCLLPCAFSLAATAQAAPRISLGLRPCSHQLHCALRRRLAYHWLPQSDRYRPLSCPNGTPHPTAAIVPPGPEAGLIYTPYRPLHWHQLHQSLSILLNFSGVLSKLFSLYG